MATPRKTPEYALHAHRRPTAGVFWVAKRMEDGEWQYIAPVIGFVHAQKLLEELNK